jgi:multidrug efflux pump subunit AcrA (membrane-fusion protein)
LRYSIDTLSEGFFIYIIIIRKDMTMNNSFDQTTSQDSTPEENKKVSWEEKYGKKKGGKKNGKKTLIIVLIVVVAVVGLGAYVASKAKSAMDTMNEAFGDGTLVDEYGKKDMSAYIDLTGVAESQNVENVVTTLQYPVKEIKVKVGDYVNAGDVVCTIETKDIEEKITELEEQASDDERIKAKQIEQANHSISSAATSKNKTINDANKTISEAKKAFDDADADYYEKLDEYNAAWEAAKKVATSTDAVENNPTVVKAKAALDAANETWYVKQYAYDQATASYSDTATAAEQNYQSVVDSAEITSISNSSSYSSTASQLATYYEMKGKTVIKAGISGIVTSIDAVEGLTPTGSIMTIQDDKNLEVNVGIKEKDIFNVREGMSVEFSSSVLENVSGKGSIDKVNKFAVEGKPNAQGTPGDNTFNAKIIINENKDILLGMKLKVRIATGEELTTNAVPYTAILSDAEGDYVYVAEEVSNGMYQVKRKSITKGMSGDYYTEIVSGDLETGDKVICYPNTVTEDGVIKINEDSDSSSSKDSKGKSSDTNADKNSED